jgi:hypothetical protein
MSEGDFAVQQRRQLEHELDSMRQDVDELQANIGKVVRYFDTLPEEPALAAIVLRVKKLLNVGPPINLKEEEQHEILNIDVGFGWSVRPSSPGSSEEDEVKESEEAQLSLVDWGEEMEAKFNDMTVEDNDGLRRMAAREDQVEERKDGDVHERSAP